MSEYTAEDFKNARFAESDKHGLAVRMSWDAEYQWTDFQGDCWTDESMAEPAFRWTPVYEASRDEVRKLRADNEALRDQLQGRQDILERQREVVKEHIDSNHDLRNQVKDLQAALPAPAPLTLDTLREAWENAEQSEGCRVGDALIDKISDADEYVVWASTRGIKLERARILHRAPQPEPWQALADVLRAHTGEPDPDETARMLHERGVRVMGGDET